MRRWILLLVSMVVACAEPERGARYVADAGDDGTPIDGAAPCTTDRSCDDFIACTVDRCRAGSCAHEPCTDCCPEGLQCITNFGCGRPPRTCATNAECSDGIRCTLDSCSDARVCQNTPQADLCAGGEICLAAVGCLPRPPDRCAVDADCATTPCSGSWRCHPELGCGFRSPINCDDSNECTADTCSNARGGCQHAARDRDGDGHGDRACGGDDCADTDAARHPGVMEVCGNGVDDNCDGAADEGCCPSAMPCTTTCGSMGTTTCTAMGTPGACMPGPETCNGRDDNCDGAVDNGFTCARGNVGACTTSCGTPGTQTCSDACTLGACVPPMEVCNGRDDNCDGRTDEGCCSAATACTASCGSMGTTTCDAAGRPSGCRPPAEACNRRDDDCDGMIDNGFACIAGSMGTCMTACGSAGQRMCNATCAWDACVPPPEMCNGRDDNCDGRVDEGCCSTSTPCATSCGTMGTTICSAAGLPTGCRPPAETCNGRDDDCDGAADNGFACVRGGTVACTTPCGTAGTRACDGLCALGACAAPAEACNGRDDDCDGMIDEGFACAQGSAAACTTACGSTGSRACSAACAQGACVPPAEVCNGRDDNCDGVADNGLACVAGATGSCTTACGSTGSRVCSGACAWGACAAPAETCNGRDDNCDGRTDEGCCSAMAPCATTCGSMGTTLCDAAGMPTGCRAPPEVCNGRDDDCDGARDNGFACVPGATGACTTACGSAGRRTCLPSCAWDTCVPPAEVCNGSDDNCNGACDEGSMCCARSTRDCTALGFASGTATCRGDCSGYDTSGCNNCGNGRVDAGEQCDGAALGGATCTSLGFGVGTLRCRSNCTYDTTPCPNCGNGRVDTGEQCDGAALGGATCTSLGMGFTGGTLACGAACAFNTAGCARPFNPTGTWLVSPGVSYMCAFGLVSYSFGNLSFSDSGTDLTVNGGGINCAMRGASSRATRMVDVSCTLPGGCTETYRLVGTYGTDNTFTGTFTATFTGGAGCFGCTTRSAAVSGTR